MIYEKNFNAKGSAELCREKVISCILYFAALEVLAVVLNVFCLMPYVTDRRAYILLITAFHAAPFLVAKFPFKIIDKNWCGEVISVDIKTKNDAFFAGGKTHSYTNHQIMLNVKKENGKVITIKAKEVGEPNPETIGLLGYTVPNQGDIKSFINYCSAGDTVYHFRLLPNYCIVKKNSDKNDCVICGAQNTSERNKCLNCGHSLIKANHTVSFM